MAKRRGKWRVMVDANVLYAGTLWRRWPYEVLRHALRRDFRLVLAGQAIDEAREAIAEDAPTSSAKFERLLTLLDYEQVDPAAKQMAKYPSLVADQDDLPIGVAAILAKVDYFVSEDKHFTEKNAGNSLFHQKVRVMRPVIFLREVMGWSSARLDQVKHRTASRG